MYGTTSCGPRGLTGEEFSRVSPLMEANDSCGMASFDTSRMDVGMTVFSHYKSMGALCQSSNPISPKTTWDLSLSLPNDVLN